MWRHQAGWTCKAKGHHGAAGDDGYEANGKPSEAEMITAMEIRRNAVWDEANSAIAEQAQGAQSEIYKTD